MTKVYLIRHAEAEGNLYRRVHGWHSSCITDEGMLQIAALEKRFLDIPVDAVYSSDLRRAMTTAQAVAAPKALELNLEPGLRELNMGVYEDMPFGEMARFHPEDQRRFLSKSPHWAPEGGETFRQVADRMTRTFFRLANDHDGQTIVLFSHSIAIRCLQAALRGKHPSQLPDLKTCENTGVSCYEVQGNKFRILFECDASHLPPELNTMGRRIRPDGPAPTVWYKSMDLSKDAKAYYAARQDAWISVHGSLVGFDGPGFLNAAREAWDWDKRSLQWAIHEDRPVGILQLSVLEGVQDRIGYIPFLYVDPQWRRKTVGVQMLGQAVATYRALGRERIQLQCSPDNRPATAFYLRYGFQKIGEVPGAMGTLDLLEKEI